ncbi:MAG TPA: glycosyltransferase family 39 protein, partial [Thermoanaerobaculia bacterium]
MRRASIDLAFLAALTLLTNFLYFAYSDGDFFYPDSRTYIEPAQSMLAGQGFVRANGIIETFRTPGYPLFLMLFRNLTAVVVVQHLMNAALAIAIYLFARRRFSRGIAIAAAVLFALDPPTIHYANKVLTETLFTAGLFALIWLVLRETHAPHPAFGHPLPKGEGETRTRTHPSPSGEGAAKRRVRGVPLAMIAIGLLSGALVLIRPAAILYFLIVAIVIGRRKQVALFVIAALLLPVAWAARNKARTGVF